MKAKSLIVLSVGLLGLAGCSAGDTNLNVSTIDNSVDNSTSGGGSSNPCAVYTDPGSGAERRGSFDGSNCTYSSTFAGAANPITVDLTIPFISGVHIFQDSLFIGENVSSGAAPAGGTGPTLTIEAGNTLAFSDGADYLLINRGAQIVANGSSTAPITLTGFTDAVTNTAGPEDVQLWGGLVINGNGITNNCTDAQRSSNACHVLAEGQPSNYGGNDNSESSGTLRYVVVKHAGFEVAPGDELNGVTFNAVGSGTTVENLQVYSSYDDGIEFFGGAVDVSNYVALYVRDDSIDFSDGYVGTIQNALIIQAQADGNRCIEGDGIGESRYVGGESPETALPLSNPTINNVTCIMNGGDVGTHSDTSEGPTFRRGPRFTINRSIFAAIHGANAADSNECLEITNDEDELAAQNGESVIADTIIACTDEPTKGSFSGSLAGLNGDTVGEWFLNNSSNGATYAGNVGNFIEQGTPPGTGGFGTVALFDNASGGSNNSFYTRAGNAFTDSTGAAMAIRSTGDVATYPMGAVYANNDWTANWTYGLHAANRGQPLWFQ